VQPKERRAAARVDIDIRGSLSNGARSIDCHLMNMCDRGFLIEADAQVESGANIDLVVPLAAEKVIRCTVQIRHVNARRLGALVTSISDADKALCSEFLRERRRVSAA
jgi:hypothetical protein